MTARHHVPRCLSDCLTLAGYARRYLPHCACRIVGRNYQIEDLSRIYSSEDPWSYAESREERRRHDLVLQSIPAGDYENVVELGCSEGIFTHKLLELFADRPTRIVGVDAIGTALERASRRCQEYLGRAARVRFVEMNLEQGRFDERFDLVIAMDVLYHISNRRRLLKVRDRIIEALEPGGLILLEHGLRDDVVEKRFFRIARHFSWSTAAIHSAFAERRELALIEEQIYEIAQGWNIQISLFRKNDGSST